MNSQKPIKLCSLKGLPLKGTKEELKYRLNKNKIDPDFLAYIIADMDHGEITTCDGFDCSTCKLNKELPYFLVGNNKITICNMLVEMSNLLE